MGFSKDQFMDERQAPEVHTQKGIIKFAEMSITKDTIAAEVDRMAAIVEAGEVDPIKAIAFLNALERITKAARAKIMPDALDEFQNYKGEKAIIVMTGCKIEEAEAGIKYNYSKTPYWQDLNERVKDATQERKDFESQIKTFKKPGMISVDDEMVEVNPPIRTSTTTLKVTIK